MPMGDSISRSTPLTMPAVTVWEMPKGLPMATTGSPTSTVPSASELRGGQLVVGLDGHDGQITLGHPAHDPARQLGAVGQLHRQVLRAGDHVVRRQDQTALVEHDAGADALRGLQLHHGVADAPDHVLHRAVGGPASRPTGRSRAAWCSSAGCAAVGSLSSRRARTVPPTSAPTSRTATATSQPRRRGLGDGAVGSRSTASLSPPAVTWPGITWVGSGVGSGSATGGLAGRCRQLRRGGFLRSVGVVSGRVRGIGANLRMEG